jgi:hypothetical protein
MNALTEGRKLLGAPFYGQRRIIWTPPACRWTKETLTAPHNSAKQRNDA